MNITKFEKDSPADYSTSFKNNLSKKENESITESSLIKRRSRSGPEKREDNDVTDLTQSGKATAPATKSRSRKGITRGIISWDLRVKYLMRSKTK